MIAPPLEGKVLGTIRDSFAVAEWRDNGGPSGPPRLIAPLHLHNHDDEAWYVLEGRLCVQVGEEQIEVPAGSGVLVPRGVAHTYWNPGPDAVRYMLFMTPAILGLVEDIHLLGDRNPESLRAVFEQHDSMLLG
ncbi:MAG TPA: cupin domain-containing protein [Terracidiphilus sp.]|jgi:mannose-6-phosphate isomerase-like protein (cupin superfamily)|nr:cupin domain-containing protein [Terracidiphilus sp.]